MGNHGTLNNVKSLKFFHSNFLGGIVMKENFCFVLELMNHHRTGLIKTIASKLGPYKTNDAEDCYQELFILAFLNQDKLSSHPNPVGWLFVTASNIACDALRKNQKNERYTVRYEDIAEISCPGGFENIVIERNSGIEEETDGLKDRILNALNEKEKELYRLKYIEKKDTKYLAQYFSTTEGCIRARLSQMRKHVKNLIEKQN